MNPDIINGLFEALAGLFILNHCRVLYRDKMCRGVSLLSCSFFTLWSLWNLVFYPNMGLFWSFVGGIFVMLANWLYASMLWYYGEKRIGSKQDDALEQEMHLRIDMIGDR